METTLRASRRTAEIGVFALALVLLFLVLVYAVYQALPVNVNANPPKSWGFAVDWKGCISHDVLLTIKGESPYESGCGLNPPWAYVLLAPIALLSPSLGSAVNFVLTYFGYLFMLYRMRLKPVVIGLFLLSPFIFQNALNGNIDWLTVLGFALPPSIGLFFVLIKPQIGFGIALYWLFEAWKNGRFKQVLRTFGPVSIAYLASFTIYGFWPMGLIRMPQDPYNSSIFPIAVPLGIILLWQAMRQRKPKLAMGASPFLMPYVNYTSFAVTLLAISQDPVTLAVIVMLLWIVR